VRALCLLAVLTAGCFKPDLGDGNVACGNNQLCPPKYFCHTSDQHCWKTPENGGDDLSVVGPIADLAGVTGDLANADLSACTKAECGARNCGMIPDGCGGVESCGSPCAGNTSCGGGSAGVKMPNVCNTGPACAPKQCVANTDCGLISDGCASVLQCGGCGTGKSCGSDNKCH
jgi:hypothetical protein